MLENIKTNLVLAGQQLTNVTLLTRPFIIAWLNLLFLLSNYHHNLTYLLPSVRVDRPAPRRLLSPPRPVSTPGFALVIIGIIGISFFSQHLQSHYKLEPVTYASPSRSSPALKAKSPPEKPKSLPASQPTELDIPSVSIDTKIVTTDLNAAGGIAVPNTPSLAGWYEQSPTPGQLGPSIIVGHVDYLTGIAVFWRLRYVQPGAEIDIARADGTTARFRVDSIHQYSQSNFPSSLVYGNINAAGLRLITCGGTFDTATGHYSDNTVVFGTLI